MSLLGLFSILYTGCQLIKEANQRTIPAGNWGNMDLIQKDRMNGMSEKEILKNVERGRYIVREIYPEPHRDKDGKITIENSRLYYEDVEKYGVSSPQVGKAGEIQSLPRRARKRDSSLQGRDGPLMQAWVMRRKGADLHNLLFLRLRGSSFCQKAEVFFGHYARGQYIEKWKLL